MLTNEIAVELIERWQKHGDRVARDRVVCAYMRLCAKVARSFPGTRNVDYLEAVHEGAFGLMKACDKFDGTRDVLFSTYATWWIRCFVIRYIRRRGSQMRTLTSTTVGLQRFWSVLRAERELWKTGDAVTPAAIATETGLTPAAVEKCMNGMCRSVSLAAPVGRDRSMTWQDVIADDSAAAVDETVFDAARTVRVRETVAELEKTLDARERVILRSRLMSDDPLTLQQIGDQFGLTRERVRQLEARLRDRIRGHLESFRGTEARAA